jgi:nucleoid-associated protein YgaU
MFTAMISRSYLAVTLIGLTLAAGAGWGLYEQRRERAVEAPVSGTEMRAPQPVGDPAAAPEAPAAATSASETAAPAEAAQAAGKSALDRGSADATTAPARLPTAAPVDAPREVANRPAPAARHPAPEEPAAAAGRAPAIGQAPPATASVSGEEPIAATGPQIAAPSSATELAPAPLPLPEPEPSATANVAAAAATAQVESAPRFDADVHAAGSAARTEEHTGSAATDRAADSEASPNEPAAAAPRIPPAAAASDQGDLAGIEPGAAPSFDIVRIAPGGRAVIAGRAAPDAEVELRSGDRVIDRVRADRRGEWVALPPELLAAGDQELTLAAQVAGRPAVESDEVLVVAVPPARPAPEAGGEPEIAAAQPPRAPLAMALPREGRGQGRILQAPGRISSDGTLALMVLDYDETGRIRLHGEASPGAPLLIYVDNAPAGAAVVEPSGKWTTVLEPSLAPGDYTLRLDQLDPSGKPTARLETPFTRASQPPVEGEVQVDFVIVQPGNSLWRIARRLYGEGLHYVHIYGANQGQIRDPDLIYPGQVFEMPSSIGASG